MNATDTDTDTILAIATRLDTGSDARIAACLAARRSGASDDSLIAAAGACADAWREAVARGDEATACAARAAVAVKLSDALAAERGEARLRRL